MTVYAEIGHLASSFGCALKVVGVVGFIRVRPGCRS